MHFLTEYPLKDEEVKNVEIFLVKAVELFQIMKPFNDYLNKALVGFPVKYFSKSGWWIISSHSFPFWEI